MRPLMRLRSGTSAAKLLSLVPLAVLTTALACANRGAAGAGVTSS